MPGRPAEYEQPLQAPVEYMFVLTYTFVNRMHNCILGSFYQTSHHMQRNRGPSVYLVSLPACETAIPGKA